MAKTVALGTILTVGAQVVGNVVTISPPGPEKPEIDVTDLSSVAHEYLMGLPDNGEMSLSGFFNYTDAGQALMLGDANNPTATVRAVILDFVSQDVRFTFNAFVKSFIPSAPGPNEAYSFDATLRVSGAVTIAGIP